ncbi:MAG: C39 family peptidase [Anaerolineae bacterium]|nr:C39 family peptidase [Anaerolineae bacterium]
MKKLVVGGIAAMLVIAFVGAAALALLARSNEAWAQRIAYVPRLAQTTLRNLQPAPVLPTPPPAGADTRARLLALTPLAPPTLPHPEVEVIGAAPLPAPLGPTPTLAPTVMATSGPTPTPSPEPVAAQVALQGVQHAYQTWNNCGPATIAMNLSYYGHYRNQAETATFLKPDADDKNVSLEQMVAYARSQGFEGIIRLGGTVELLQRLLANGFPVIVEDWMEPEDRGGIGHYRLFTGYDTAAGHFVAQDSYYGPNRPMAMAEFDATWRVFNRRYAVIYRPEALRNVEALLGAMANDEAMLAHTLTVARDEAEANPGDVFAWFNLGTTYSWLGETELAAAAFDEARRIGLPFRMLWYQMEPFEAYLGAGRYEEVIQLAEATLQTTGNHEEAHYYQGLAYQALGNGAAAGRALRKALDYNPNFAGAAEALAALE